MSTSFHRTKSKSKSMLLHFFQHRYLRTSPVASTTKTLEKHESVLNFFKSYGFSDAHLAKITAKTPSILKAKVDKTLKPKIDCLADYGISGSFLHELIVSNPVLMSKSLNYQLRPILHLLQTYLGSKEKTMADVKRYSSLLSYGSKGTMEQNINFLVSEGVPIKSISHLICLVPRTIHFKIDRMVHAVKSANQFGFHPADPMFIRAVIAILSISESTFTKKIEFVKNLLGCSQEEFNSAFKRFPCFLNSSEEKMKNVTNFFVNTMKVEASVLLSAPEYYGYSVDKRMVPRYNVYKILESKKLLKEGTEFPRLLYRTEKWFEINYVVKYLDQVPNLMELYHGFIRMAKNPNQVSSVSSLTYNAKVCLSTQLAERQRYFV